MGSEGVRELVEEDVILGFEVGGLEGEDAGEGGGGRGGVVGEGEVCGEDLVEAGGGEGVFG